MKKALFVGVDDYKDPQIRNLSFSLADAFSLNAVFENLGYDTKVLANPTRLDLITAIRECNQSLKQGDSFFFYFAGHGWTTTGGVHLLFCSDDVYDPNGNFNAGVSFGGLKAETTGNGYNRAFVLDACRSHFLEGARDVVDNTTRDLRPIGELLEEDNQQNNAGSLAVIRSCSQNEHAIEIAAAQHGLFTLAMQSVMRGAIQEGRQLSFGTEFCSEITAEMRAFANEHNILNTQTPEFAMAGERQVLIPGRPRNNRENAPIYYSCPICGKNNLVTETFNCKKCSTEYLCLSHKSQELGICEKCYSTTVSQPPPAPRDINKVKCADIPDQILKKGLACPECHLFDEALDCALVKGKDYVVQYEDADSPGFATVVITGIGKYHGERRVTFEIKKEDIPISPTPDVQEEPPASLPESSQVVPVIDRPWFKWLALPGVIALIVGVVMVADSSRSYSAVDSSASRPSASVQENKLDGVSQAQTYRPAQCYAPAYDGNKRYEDGSCSTFTLPGGVEMEMVYVAPGEFNMGSEDDVLGAAPVHPVKITKGYWIGKYPVTQAQWVTLIAYSKLKLKNVGQWFCNVGGGKDYVKGLDTSDFPMESISWNDCDALVKALNSNETLSVEWMIPTEAQWEFAAKGGNKSKGYKFSGCDDIDMVGWYMNNSGGRTHSVLEKVKGNELGIVGMSGNVWEWCRDTYDTSYYQQCKVKGMVEDPCNVAASGVFRVLRGGCWFSNARHCRSAYRDWHGLSSRVSGYGFRLACSAGPHENLTEQESRGR